LRAAVLVVAGSTAVSVPERYTEGDFDRALLDRVDPGAAAPAVAPRPVLMMNADHDEVFSRRSALALFDALLPPKEIIFLPGGHSRWHDPARWNHRMFEFLAGALGPGGAPEP
jgi:fermentation-respiration switch protein FrsA (DUF1100 family)